MLADLRERLGAASASDGSWYVRQPALGSRAGSRDALATAGSDAPALPVRNAPKASGAHRFNGAESTTSGGRIDPVAWNHAGIDAVAWRNWPDCLESTRVSKPALTLRKPTIRLPIWPSWESEKPANRT